MRRVPLETLSLSAGRTLRVLVEQILAAPANRDLLERLELEAAEAVDTVLDLIEAGLLVILYDADAVDPAGEGDMGAFWIEPDPDGLALYEQLKGTK